VDILAEPRLLPTRLIDAAMEAQRTQRQGGAALRRCFHETARIESVAAGGVFDLDESLARIAAAVKGGLYSPGTWEFEEVAPDVVLSWTNVRHAPPGGRVGHTVDTPLIWLMTGREGLIWRVRVFRERGEALETLAEHGLALGI
jgi:hypothetical protein